MDDPEVHLVEVTATWNNDLLHVAHLRPGEVFSPAGWPCARALVTWERDRAHVAPLGGELEVDDGSLVAPCATSLPVHEGVTVRVVFGGVVFAVRRGKALRVRLPTCRPDTRFRAVWTLTLFVMLVLLAAARASGGPSRAELFHARMRDLDARLRQLERRGVVTARLRPEERATFEARPVVEQRYPVGITTCCFCFLDAGGCCAPLTTAVYQEWHLQRGRRMRAVLLDVHRAWSAAEVEAVTNDTRAAIRRVVRRHAPEVRRCSVKALRASAEVRGGVVIRWITGAHGSVLTSSVVDGDAPALGECIVKSVVTWRFPRAVGNEPLVVTYAFASRARE